MSALKLAQSLIQIKSVSPYDEGCFDLIETALVPMGFEIERDRDAKAGKFDFAQGARIR